MIDNRKLIYRVEKLKKNEKDAKSPKLKKSKSTEEREAAHQLEQLCATFGIGEETMKLALDYPNNLKLG